MHKGCISKVVQRVWNYLDINFHASSLNGYGVMDFIVIILNMFFYKNFVVSEYSLRTSQRFPFPSLTSDLDVVQTYNFACDQHWYCTFNSENFNRYYKLIFENIRGRILMTATVNG